MLDRLAVFDNKNTAAVASEVDFPVIAAANRENFCASDAAFLIDKTLDFAVLYKDNARACRRSNRAVRKLLHIANLLRFQAVFGVERNDVLPVVAQKPVRAVGAKPELVFGVRDYAANASAFQQLGKFV